jgi:hypothetical protein
VSSLAVRSPDLLGRAEQSSPNAAWRRAEGAGLDGEDADRAIISVTALRVVVGHCPRGQVPNFTTDAAMRSRWSPAAIGVKATYTSASNTTRTFRDVRFQVAIRCQADLSKPHSTGRIYEYAPFCNGPRDVKSPRVIVTPPSLTLLSSSRHTVLLEGMVSLSRYAWFVR